MKWTYAIPGIVLVLLILSTESANAQNRPEESQIQAPTSSLWLGTYSNARLGEKLFWAGEFHFRTDQDNNTPYIGRVAQIYNRHGIKYQFSKQFSSTVGGVLRLNFSPDPGNDAFEDLVLEPRIWHEYVFAMPFSRFMVYHRIRIEHRWSRSNRIGSDWIFRNRYRYKFFMKIPLNKKILAPKTIYFSPDIELIMQSGKQVVDSPFEDLRLYPILGYIVNPRLSVSAGMMYTTGQTLEYGYNFRSRWVMRFNVYLSLDFRKFEDKIPTTKFFD